MKERAIIGVCHRQDMLAFVSVLDGQPRRIKTFSTKRSDLYGMYHSVTDYLFAVARMYCVDSLVLSANGGDLLFTERLAGYLTALATEVEARFVQCQYVGEEIIAHSISLLPSKHRRKVPVYSALGAVLFVEERERDENPRA